MKPGGKFQEFHLEHIHEHSSTVFCYQRQITSPTPITCNFVTSQPHFIEPTHDFSATCWWIVPWSQALSKKNSDIRTNTKNSSSTTSGKIFVLITCCVFNRTEVCFTGYFESNNFTSKHETIKDKVFELDAVIRSWSDQLSWNIVRGYQVEFFLVRTCSCLWVSPVVMSMWGICLFATCGRNFLCSSLESRRLSMKSTRK